MSPNLQKSGRGQPLHMTRPRLREGEANFGGSSYPNPPQLFPPSPPPPSPHPFQKVDIFGQKWSKSKKAIPRLAQETQIWYPNFIFRKILELLTFSYFWIKKKIPSRHAGAGGSGLIQGHMQLFFSPAWSLQPNAFFILSQGRAGLLAPVTTYFMLHTSTCSLNRFKLI